MKLRASLLAAPMVALCLAPGVGAAQTAPASQDYGRAALQPDPEAPPRRPLRRALRRPHRDPTLPSSAADLAALRHGEAIAHGATTETEAPTTNPAYTGGPGLKGNILKSGPTGPQ